MVFLLWVSTCQMSTWLRYYVGHKTTESHDVLHLNGLHKVLVLTLPVLLVLLWYCSPFTVEVLKRHASVETVENRAARTLGNLAVDPEGSEQVHCAGLFLLLL